MLFHANKPLAIVGQWKNDERTVLFGRGGGERAHRWHTRYKTYGLTGNSGFLVAPRRAVTISHLSLAYCVLTIFARASSDSLIM